MFTSDLFQVRVCEAHKKAERKAKNEEMAKLLAEFKAKQKGEAPATTPVAEAGEEITEDAEAQA